MHRRDAFEEFPTRRGYVPATVLPNVRPEAAARERDDSRRSLG
jgi:hypothetical protein